MVSSFAKAKNKYGHLLLVQKKPMDHSLTSPRYCLVLLPKLKVGDVTGQRFLWTAKKLLSIDGAVSLAQVTSF